MAESLWDRFKGWIADNHAVARIETGMRENAAGVHLNAPETSYARYLRETENGGDRFAAWEGHEQRTAAARGDHTPDIYGQDITDRSTGKEYRIEAADVGKAGHAIQVKDAETDRILYSWQTTEQNPSTALEEGKQWLEQNVMVHKAADLVNDATAIDAKFNRDKDSRAPDHSAEIEAMFNASVNDLKQATTTAAVSQGERDAARASAPTPEHAGQMAGREVEKSNDRGLER